MVVQLQAGSLLTVTTLCSGSSRQGSHEEVTQDDYAVPVNAMLVPGQRMQVSFITRPDQKRRESGLELLR